MLNQAAILFDVIRQEQQLATSPSRMERRRLVRDLAARCRCAGSSLAVRLGLVADPATASCCAAA